MTYKLPKQYEWVRRETGPRIFVEAVKLLGVTETPGEANNPTIMAWAKATHQLAYTKDSIPWCGLGMAYICLQAGWDIPQNPLWALNWANFGQPAPDGIAMLGDILVKKRAGGGHVTMYAAEDKTHYHCIGSNQNDMVNIVRYKKTDFIHIRRCKWRINQPARVRRIFVAPTGLLASKEN